MEMQPSLRYTGIILAILAATGLTACGGGSGTTAASNNGPVVAAVTLPSSAAPLTSKTNTNAKAALAGVSAAYRALSAGTVRVFTAPSTSAYATDRAGTEVQVEGQRALDQVNMVLCYLDQAAPGLVLKADKAAATYTAKVNNGTCDSDPGGNNSKGSKFTTMTLIATPQTATAKETVKFWAELPGTPPQRVHALITATSGVTASNPFGVWVLNYDMEMKSPTGWVSATNGTNPSTGTLQASAVGGQPQLLMYENVASSSFSDKMAVKVRYNTGSKTAGQAHLSVTSSFGGNTQATTNVLAFNTGYVDIGKDVNGTPSSICRDRTKFIDHVYRYQLYYAAAATVKGKAVTAGQRVKLNTGFPFTTAAGKHGYAGSWGAWLDDGTPLADGTVVNRMDNFQTGATSKVTAHVTTGRLDRQVSINQTVADIAGIDFQYNDYSQSSSSTYKVHFDKTSGHLIATATINNSSNGFSATPISSKDLTPGTNQYPMSINLYSFGSGNSESLQLSTNTAPGLTTSIQTISTEAVSGGDPALIASSGLKLYCWSNCPVGGTTGGIYDGTSGWQPGTSFYTATSVNGIVAVTDDTNGKAVTGTKANPVNMWQLTTSPTAPWNSSAIPTQYNYSAGGQWDSMVTFTNNANGSVVTFDKPLRFTYTHKTTNDRNNVAIYNGKKFPLTFDGFQLQGFPTMPDAHGNGWMLSAVNLKDGVSLTDSKGVKYVIRAMGIQQVPDWAAASACSAAGLNTAGISTSLTLPSSGDMTAVPTKWADKPTVSSGPRVVEGVLQY